MASKKKADFRANHKIIKEAFLEFIKQNKKPPTLEELAEITEFHTQTIYNHLKELKLEDITPKFKLMGEDVIYGLAQSGTRGSSKAAKLFFKLVYDWKEKQEVEITEPIEVIIKRE